MAKKRNTRLPKELLDGIYDPEFIPDELHLNEFISTTDNKEAEDKVKKKIQSGLDRKKLPAVNVPLTEAEALAADQAIEETMVRLSMARDHISATRSIINDVVGEAGASRPGGEINFDVNIKRKPFLKKAVRKVFGRKSDSITYSMYLEALAIKREIEEQQAEGYTSGEFFATKEEEGS